MVVGAGSGTGPTAESLSGERVRREVGSDISLGLAFGFGFGLGFGLGFEFFDYDSSSLENLLFLEVLFPVFLLLF